eukprot:COSAG02_NODE_31970_length_524_cov_0.969412_1_plen_74_part_10
MPACIIHTSPDEFEEWFTLTPSEFNELFQWVQPELDALPSRRLPTRERLALTLHHLRTGCTAIATHRTHKQIRQ